MSRYLNPSKLSLLALAWLYCTTDSPNSNFEELTPASLHSILRFIVSHILPGTAENEARWEALRLSDFERILKDCPSSCWPGKSGWDIFLEKLWQDFQCLDDLYRFFKIFPYDVFEPTRAEQTRKENDPELRDRPDLLAYPITRSSPLGVFVRRACLEFTRLQFDDTIKLWESFISYRAPTEAAWRRKHPEARDTSHSTSLLQQFGQKNDHPLNQKAYGHLEESTNGEVFASIDDVERLLEYQIEQLQSASTHLYFK